MFLVRRMLWWLNAIRVDQQPNKIQQDQRYSAQHTPEVFGRCVGEDVPVSAVSSQQAASLAQLQVVCFWVVSSLKELFCHPLCER